MLREHAASLDPDSFVSEVIRVLEGEDEAPTAAKPQERPIMRWRKKFGVVFVRYSPGWQLEVWRLYIYWHVLTSWRWGYPTPRLASVSLHKLHVGKRLLSWEWRPW